jgi:hypothetical protein
MGKMPSECVDISEEYIAIANTMLLATKKALSERLF